MTSTVIIAFCVLLLIAYLFDLSASKTKIPSVILLLLLGWFVRQITDFLNINIPDLFPFLPIFGTIGLILIVLDGSLELELNRSKVALIRKSFFGALIPMIAMAALVSYLFRYYGDYSFKDSLINAIPFCIISSAIAIPSVRNLPNSEKEFIIYESSLSDILGVIFFNFVAHNDSYGFQPLVHFGLQLSIITIVSLAATIGLSFLLSKIEHRIKFVPIVLLIILIYALSEVYHLPALVFIMVFGLSIGNIEEIIKIRWIERFKPDILNKEVQKFRELVSEGAFLTRALFFLLFGYLIETREILNTGTLVWAGIIVGIIFLFRLIQLLVSRLPVFPLLFVAPRGLITILLFLTILPEHVIPIVNNSLIIQVILIIAVIMMFGMMTTAKKALPADQTRPAMPPSENTNH